MAKKQVIEPIPFDLTERIVLSQLETSGNLHEQMTQLNVMKKLQVTQDYLNKVKATHRRPTKDDPKVMETVKASPKSMMQPFNYEPISDDFSADLTADEVKILSGWLQLLCEKADKRGENPHPVLVKLYWRLTQ